MAADPPAEAVTAPASRYIVARNWFTELRATAGKRQRGRFPWTSRRLVSGELNQGGTLVVVENWLEELEAKVK